VAKRKKERAEETAPRPKPPPAIGTSLKAALAGVTLPDPKAIAAAKAAAEKAEREKEIARAAAERAARSKEPLRKDEAARPSATLRGEERYAYFEAIAGVRPLDDRRPQRLGSVLSSPAPGPDPAALARDREARERLASLVSGGLRFAIERDGDEIFALREGAPKAALSALSARTASAERELDLHGASAADVEARVSRFVRGEHRRGVRRVLLICGKGLHSGGAPVLRDAALDALTRGGAAPLVVAIASAPPGLGGTGALLVQLE
jgi:DNA-nicking Smr family endonuclease